MKKFWILLVVGLGLLTSLTVHAADFTINASRLPYGANYIDLRNIKVGYRDLDMKTHIVVKPDTVYTVVMDIDFIGPDTFDQDEFPQLTVCVKDQVDCSIKDMSIDRTHSRWYVTFTSTASTLMIQNIPVTGLVGYNLMMFEGQYTDFNGFEYYISHEPIVYEGVYVMDYDQPKTEAELKAQLIVSDPKGGPIKVDLVAGDYNLENIKVGQYFLKYKASDAMSNTSYFNLLVRVIDRANPVIVGQEAWILEHGKPMSLETILSQMTVSDNVDTLTYQDIEVTKDTYSPNQNRAGSYELELSLKDASLNETKKTLTIQVVDKVAPVITGPDIIYTYLSDGVLTSAQIKQMFKAVDAHDGDLSEQITVQMMDYNGSFTKMHTLYVRCRDVAGNESLKILQIHVIDDTAPIFQTTEYILTLAAFQAMSREEVIAWLTSKLEATGIQATNLTILLDETEHLNQPRQQAYVYYSYEVNGEVHQSRIAVSYPKKQTISPLYIGLGMGVIAVSASGFLIIRKLKKS